MVGVPFGSFATAWRAVGLCTVRPDTRTIHAVQYRWINRSSTGWITLRSVRDTLAMDALSHLFGSLRVDRALCTRFEVTAPWGHRVTHRGQLKFVLVVDGSCWLRTAALPGATRLDAHGLFLVLDGAPYTLSDAPGSPAVDCGQLEHLRDGYLIRHGGGGARTTLVSVAFEVDAADNEALLLALPPFIHLRVDQPRSHGLQSLVELLRVEVSASEPGSLPIVRRLGEALFMSAVRAYLQQDEDRPPHDRE
ncbi:MAG: AraC family transcriptional regulator, partial [Myxococcales bacterium]